MQKGRSAPQKKGKEKIGKLDLEVEEIEVGLQRINLNVKQLQENVEENFVGNIAQSLKLGLVGEHNTNGKFAQKNIVNVKLFMETFKNNFKDLFFNKY